MASGDARRWAQPAVFAALLVVAISRSLYILFVGRFWAEEGFVYFEHARRSSLDHLFFVYERVGYYHLYANVATWFASLVPLRLAPLVTAWLSFALLATVVWVALTWPSDLLSTPTAHVGAATLLVVGTLATSEVWLNAANAQVYLGILAVLFLFVDVNRLGSRTFAFGVVALLVAALSGAYAVALAPVYVVRAWWERSYRQTVFAAAVVACAVVQLVALRMSRASGDFSGAKLHLPGAGAAARSAVWQGAAFVFGPNTGTHALRWSRAHGRTALVVGALCAVAVVALVGVVFVRTTRLRVVALLVASYALVEAVASFGANRQVAAGRYSVVPNAILTLALVCAAATAGRTLTRVAAIMLCAVVVLSGAINFWGGDPPRNLRCEGCPVWRDEVRAWEAGESEALRIWPYPKTMLVLRR